MEKNRPINLKHAIEARNQKFHQKWTEIYRQRWQNPRERQRLVNFFQLPEDATLGEFLAIAWVAEKYRSIRP